MKYEILLAKKEDKTLSYAVSRLPLKLKAGIISFLEKKPHIVVNEIRIKLNSYIILISGEHHYSTDVFISRDDIDETVLSLCNGSIYAHSKTINEGYIAIGQGIRAGICGKALIENDMVTSVASISSINIRIPQKIEGASNYLIALLKSTNYNSSVLLYSPPGVGKTTILRDLVTKLSTKENPLCFSIIDAREEITPYLDKPINADVYLSYPKGLAIEMATKVMTPEFIICDEIASENDAIAILKASNSGVKLIATTHASSFEELKSKEILKPLFTHNIFNYALGVERHKGARKYIFTLNELK